MNLDNLVSATDTANVEAGGRSFFDQSYDLLTKGAGSAVISGVYGLANSAIALGNALGADAEELDTRSTLLEIDKDWATYYDRNKNAVDAVGFLGASLLPGSLAVKGLRMAQGGRALGTFGNALGYTVRTEEALLTTGLREISRNGGTAFANLNWTKAGLMATGAGQAALETAVFETAAALTQFKSPYLEKEEFGSIVKDGLVSVALGGAIGGVFTRVFANKVFSDAGKAVEAAANKYSSIANLEKSGLVLGDVVYSQLDEVLKLLRPIAEEDKKLAFSYQWNGKTKTVDGGLDIGALVSARNRDALANGQLVMERMLTEAVKADPTVGRPLATAILQILQHSGSDLEGAREKAGNLLFNLKGVQGLYADEAVNYASEVVYLSPSATLLQREGVGQQVHDLLSNIPKSADSQAFRIEGDINKTTVAILGTNARTQKEAFEKGFDWFIDGKGRININPNSAIYRPAQTKVDDLKKVYNPYTQTVSDSAVPAVADLASGAKKLERKATGVVAGNYNFTFSVEKHIVGESTSTVTARHFWASGLTETDVANKIIQPRDFSIVDALYQRPELRAAKGVKIADDTGLTTAEVFTRFKDWLTEQKVTELRFQSQPGKMFYEKDVREIAMHLNADPLWVETVIANKFDMRIALDTAGVSRPLASWGQRENLILTYDKKVMDAMARNGFEAQSDVAYRQRVKLAKDNAVRVTADVLGKDHELFQDFDPSLLRTADAEGAGASGFASSNAGYEDRLRLLVQDTGKNVSLVSQRWREEAVKKLRPSAELVLASKEASNELVALRTKLQLSPGLYTLQSFPEGWKIVDLASWRRMKGDLNGASFKEVIPVSDTVANFLSAHHDLHMGQLEKRRKLAAAMGTPIHWDADALYLPPIDTARVPYFAFVRHAQGKMFAGSDVAMITARTPEELRRLADNFNGMKEYQVIFKRDGELYHKAKGDYDFQKALNQPSLDPFLRKEGKLGDFLPSFNIDAHMEDFLGYHARKSSDIAREAVQVRYGQLLNELQWMSQQTTRAETSKLQYIGKEGVQKITDPYGDYVRTMLDISKQTEYTVWHQMSEFVDALGTRAYQAVERATQQARMNQISWTEANDLMEAYGLPRPFANAASFAEAQVSNDRNLFRVAIGKAHSVLANFGLRFDVANAIVQTMSTPILLSAEVSAIKRAAAKDPKLAGMMADLYTVTSPQGTKVPSALKLMGESTRIFFQPEGKKLIERYKQIGALRTALDEHHQMMDDLALWNKVVPSKFNEFTAKWTEKIATITGNNWSEEFSRFLAADSMRQLSDPLVAAGKMSLKEQNALIVSHANRIHGNYVTSQRPIVFQGTLGAAVSLFQTYQFNLYQQLFRHIENRDMRTLAVAGALQTSLFGMSGMPMFDAINTHLIGNASMNEGHRDIYSTTMQLAGKDLGEWLLYGTASAFPAFSDKAPALYTRGDLNPRSLTVLPVNPADWPGVQLAGKLVETVKGMASMASNGADLSSVFLHGLEHQGVSRPLAGLAQVLQGYSTTKEGNLAQANDLMSISSASRLLGARPMDESIALNANYRVNAYRAADKERLDQLGSAVKERIRKGTLQPEDVEEFAAKYAAAGGRVENYGAAMQRWLKGANQSTVNAVMEAQRNEYGRRLMEIMGADPLDDLSSGGYTPRQAPPQ